MTDPLERYQREEVLGEGTYGIVYKALDKETNNIVALKRIRLDQADEGIPATAIREISILKELQHPNVVSLLSVVHTDSKLTLVFEYLDLDLKKYMDKHGRLNESQIRSFFGQLAEGLAYVHNRRILHRDLKPENLLISETQDPVLKIADFGLARGTGIPVRSFTNEVVTLWYRCPAVLLGSKKYGAAIDIWSAGCIFYEMATGKPLFPAKNEKDEIEKIFKTFGTPNESTWKNCRELPLWADDFPQYSGISVEELLPEMCVEGRDLFMRMMQLDPDLRICARDILKHKYFEVGH